MKMRYLGAWVSLVCLFLAGSCDCKQSGGKGEEKYWKKYTLVKSEFESLIIGVGSGLHGLEFMLIKADGRAEMKYLANGEWERVTFGLSPDEIDGAVALINDSRVLALDASYVSDVRDGTQRIFVLKASGRVKSLYCSNYEPKQWVNVKKGVEKIFSKRGVGSKISMEEAGKLDREVWGLIRW